MTKTLTSHLRQTLQPKHILPALTTGFIVALLDVFVEISLAVMIFSGDLSAYVSRGIGFALFGAMTLSFVAIILTSFPGSVVLPQDSPAAILALMATSIAARLAVSATTESVFATFVVTVMLTTVLTGFLFLLLGQFKLGGMVRYIPYPVFGGFLAGTGWLLVQGGMGLVTGASLTVSQLPALFKPDTLFMWGPSVLFAVLLTLILRRHSHFLIVPASLLLASGLFYLILWLAGLSIAEATTQGWLLGTFPAGRLWQPLSFEALQQVEWRAVAGQVGNIGTIMLISVVSLLLNASGIEVTAQKDIDLNRELKAAGIANCVAGLGGSTAGYHALSLSTLGLRLGANSRLIGLTVAVANSVMLFFGAKVLSYLPKPVLGGLIIFMGLGFLIEWLYDGWRKLAKADYVIVWLILIMMTVVGVLEGVGLGLVLAVILFAINYSRIDVVKNALSRTTYHSHVGRPRLYQQLLNQKGDWVYILKLQGFIFFGTANKLLEQIRQRLHTSNKPLPHFVVLDFRHVLGLDASAELTLVKLKQLTQAQNISLVFTHLSPKIQQRLEKGVFTEADRTSWYTFSDLDHGVEWCEEQMIQIFESVGLAAHPKSVKQQLEAFLPKSQKLTSLFEYLEQEDTAPPPSRAEALSVTHLLTYMERQDVVAGQYLVRQGEKPQGLYFIESGRITVQLESPDGRVARVRTMNAGTIVGEIGLYLGSQTSAAVVAEEAGTLYYLSSNNLKKMESEAPALAAAFHKFVAQHLSERLAETMEILQALSD
jgi:SulP family sulfate permease